MNLVTGVTSLAFNPTTEILAVASRKMKEAVRLVITPFTFPLYLDNLTFHVETVNDNRKVVLDYFKE